jgi:hypothetical protein
LSTKTEQLEWRRQKVIELKAIGLNHSEIARELQVARTCIVEDVQYLRKRAKDSIKEYVTEHLPEQYQICMTALDTILKNAFVIMSKSEDNREKLQALQLFKDTHITKLELLSNATTIDSALDFIRSQQKAQQEQQSQQSLLQQQDKDDNGDSNGSQVTAATTTTTGNQIANERFTVVQ